MTPKLRASDDGVISQSLSGVVTVFFEGLRLGKQLMKSCFAVV